WTDVARQLRHAIGGRPVIIFNARFDIRILKQTAAAHRDPADWLEEMTVYCAMELAAGYYGVTNRYGTISLASAASQAGLKWSTKTGHRVKVFPVSIFRFVWGLPTVIFVRS
ncbi:3'-5' exonuclease, partial [Escherichia coli]|nr:3'-5' exonuclease [Escherichia coli]